MPTTMGLVARYADADGAGRAIERLSLHGVDAGRIALIGDDAASDRATQRATDAGTTRRLAGRLGSGALVGVVAGAVLGAIVLYLFSGTGMGALAGAVGGAAAGAGLGALAGLQSTPTMSTAWASTFGRGGEAVVVTVEASDEAAMDELQDTLDGTGAVEVRRTHDLRAATRRSGS